MNMSNYKRFLPKTILNIFRPPYHYLMAVLGALIYRFPSKKIKVVAVTGTKGKSSVTEMINAVLEEAGFKTALTNTLRFKIGDQSDRNLYKMTMPGRFFLQKALRQAVKAKCDYAVIEMTSEGAKQFRHKFIDLDALIFTNLSPEHIESHGSYENYVKAKLNIAQALTRSSKKNKILVVNKDSKEAEKFLAITNVEKATYSLSNVSEINYTDDGSSFNFAGQNYRTKFIGEFNIYNLLATITFAKHIRIPEKKIKSALEKMEKIKGRVERIKTDKNFEVVVDYAHTIDSLEKFYSAFSNKKKICVLGNTGGGRDKWKRPGMAKVANENCEEVILTNEDPYDEDPKKILDEMAVAVDKNKLKVILDRREAIKEALKSAGEKAQNQADFVVLISGKGTDPFIMEANGKKTPWDDAEVVREELKKLGFTPN